MEEHRIKKEPLLTTVVIGIIEVSGIILISIGCALFIIRALLLMGWMNMKLVDIKKEDIEKIRPIVEKLSKEKLVDYTMDILTAIKEMEIIMKRQGKEMEEFNKKYPKTTT